MVSVGASPFSPFADRLEHRYRYVLNRPLNQKQNYHRISLERTRMLSSWMIRAAQQRYETSRCKNSFQRWNPARWQGSGNVAEMCIIQMDQDIAIRTNIQIIRFLVLNRWEDAGLVHNFVSIVSIALGIFKICLKNMEICYKTFDPNCDFEKYHFSKTLAKNIAG